MSKPAIVIIAYNRERSLKRLLDSVAAADYPDEEITLVISVDRAKDGSGEATRKLAEDFSWEHGKKQLILHEENLGLKKHVLSCGDLSREYGSVILLEDDLYVSPAFYLFAKEALAFAGQDDRIGGISLYNHLLNVHVREPFAAIHTPYDNWYFQFASSWGQAFTDTQWKGFKTWLKTHDNTELAAEDVPGNVSSWSDRSWLKYYIKYLIETDRFFLYPSVSYTTNFGDEGTHASEAVNDLQVPLSGRREKDHPFFFAKPDETGSIYDAFFENILLKRVMAKELKEITGEDVAEKDVTIDLYGYRADGAGTRYLLSSCALPKKILKSYARQLRPLDENIFADLKGKDFFLYDLKSAGQKPRVEKARRILYDHRALRAGQLLTVALYRLKKKF